jgi:hypothetical protein
MARAFGIRDLECADARVFDVGEQFLRLVHDVIDVFERDVDDVVFGIVGNADQRCPLLLDLFAEIERRNLDFRLTSLERL